HTPTPTARKGMHGRRTHRPPPHRPARGEALPAARLAGRTARLRAAAGAGAAAGGTAARLLRPLSLPHGPRPPADRRQRRRRPARRLLRLHLEMTLGTRQFDEGATTGRAPYETAVAEAMALAVRRIATRGWPLVSRYVWETACALVHPAPEPPRPVVSYRRCAR